MESLFFYERSSSFVLNDRSFLALACKACYSETAFYRTGRVRYLPCMSIHSPGETSTKHIFLRWAIEKPLFDHTTFYLKHVLLHSFEKKNFLGSVVRPIKIGYIIKKLLSGYSHIKRSILHPQPCLRCKFFGSSFTQGRNSRPCKYGRSTSGIRKPYKRYQRRFLQQHV